MNFCSESVTNLFILISMWSIYIFFPCTNGPVGHTLLMCRMSTTLFIFSRLLYFRMIGFACEQVSETANKSLILFYDYDLILRWLHAFKI